MLFSFKQKSQDFIVEELLPFELKGKGDAFFVYFEKRNLNTMEIIQFLCKELNISRLTLGFAGLKDKDAITRQRVSIYKSALKKMGGEKVFLNTLAQKTRILKTSRNDKPIGMTSEVHNTFHIRLRALKKLSQTERQNTENLISDLFKEGFPNIYGSQRFGIEGRNWKMGKDIIDGKLKIKEKFETKFKLQAYASRLFNQYIFNTTKKGMKLLDGDIVEIIGNKAGEKNLAYFDQSKKLIQIFEKNKSGKDFFSYPGKIINGINFNNQIEIFLTGPIVGFDLLLPNINTMAGKKEKDFLESYGLNNNNLKIYKELNIYGLRRKLRTGPQNTMFRFDNDDVLIDFTLDSGVYASVFIDILLKRLGKIK